jgi:hypothetical protein
MLTTQRRLRHNGARGQKAGAAGGREDVGRKVLTWLVIAFVVYFVLKEPTRAGDIVQNTAAALNHAGKQVLSFFNSIA